MTEVVIFDEQSDLSIDPESVKRVALFALASQACTADELIIHFVDAEKICQLHDEFFQDPTITDCISFPMDQDRSFGYQLLGEIFVCPKQAILYASENQLDAYSEATLYLIHGILHLLGYDDIEPSDEKIMRAKEREIMAGLKANNILLNG